jgi:hypothetical protein
MKHLTRITLFVLLFVLALPVFAQDGTSEAAPVATVESGSVVIVSGDGESSVVENAQDGTVIVTPREDNPINYVIVVIAGVVIVAVLIFGGVIVGYVSKLVPPETANSIYQSGVRMGLQLALNNAAQTPTPYDNEFFEGLAQTRGFEVIKHADGHYEVRTPTAKPSGLG